MNKLTLYIICTLLAIGGRLSAAEVALKDSQCATYSEIPMFAPVRGGSRFIKQSYTAPAGKVLCELSLLYTIRWDAKTESVELNSKQLSAKANQGTTKPIGKRETIVGFLLNDYEDTSPLLSAYRSYDWKEKPITQHRVHRLFLVDADAKELEAKVGKETVKVAIPPAARYEPWQNVKVKFVSAKPLDALTKGDNFGNTEEQIKFVNRDGAILAVKLELQRAKPRKEFDASPDPYDYLEVDQFCLLFGRGGLAACLGKESSGGLDYDHSFRFEAEGLQQESQTVTLCFPIPITLTQFDVALFNQVVAKGKVSR
ncbi:hypothetical protein [Anatilimnocola floriformis]|uniref:hypothetical protein n=1 Tax=Anatilimnocola floriformis TaxID=2948575 RepID=UPI0020C58894|nr:hypothetical protein [Anatilimnocola floriformis]